ncbi:ankyrin repeat domain-containing protein [bacterium]|nr:ankyrin repeat domain-containing protein [bacterium]
MKENKKVNIWYRNLKLEEIISYFNLSADEITYESIKEVLLKDLDVQEYNSALNIILFCGLQEKKQIDTVKSLKFIEVLLQKGFNANYCAPFYGVNLIQYAIEKGYSTEFVVDLINLTKKYNLNVNARDTKGNSIIHTAIETRNYLGEILPLMKALGKEFNFNCKDKNGKDIIVKFNMCKNKARRDLLDAKEEIEYYKNEENNHWLKYKKVLESIIDTKEMLLQAAECEEKFNYISSYYDRLVSEENSFRKTINWLRNPNGKLSKPVKKSERTTSTPNLDVKQVKQNTVSNHKSLNDYLFLKVDNILSKLTFNFIIQNKEVLTKLKDKLVALTNDQTISLGDKKVVVTKLETFDEMIQQTLAKEIEVLKTSNDISYLSDLESQLQENGFQVQQQMVRKIINDYQNKVKELADNIKYNLTLENSREIEKVLTTLASEDKKKLIKDFQSRKKNLVETIDKLEKLQLSSVIFSVEQLPKEVYSQYNLTKLNEIIIKIKREKSNQNNRKSSKLQVDSSNNLLSKNLKLVRKRNFSLIEPVVSAEKLTKTELLNQQESVKKALEIYQAQINKLRDDIVNNLTLNNIDEFREIIAVLDDSNKEELSEIFETKESKLLNLIEKMKSTPSYGMEKLPKELYSDYNLSILKKLVTETKKDRFIGDTMINIRLQSEFAPILTSKSLSVLGQDEFQEQMKTLENQTFSSKVKVKKK